MSDTSPGSFQGSNGSASGVKCGVNFPDHLGSPRSAAVPAACAPVFGTCGQGFESLRVRHCLPVFAHDRKMHQSTRSYRNWVSGTRACGPSLRSRKRKLDACLMSFVQMPSRIDHILTTIAAENLAVRRRRSCVGAC